jgi:Ca2+-binding EF-hand superfamily protein
MDADSLCLENFDLLDSLYHELQTCSKEWGTECNFLYGSFGTGNEKEYRKVSVEEFKEFLWAAGVRHPYLLEELQSIMNCFIEKTSGTMNIPLFCKFLKKGPSVLRERSKGSLDIYITRLQDELRNHMAGKDAEERLHKLFVECDEDGNGSISKDEFLKVLNKAGLRSLLSQDDERMLLEFLDADGDGVINYYEFVEFALNADNALVNSIAGRKDKTDVVEKRGSQKSPTNQQWIKDYGKTTSANPRSHATREILSKICDLKRQLPNSFEFPNYFKRYRCGEAGDMVSIKNFQKIMEKFLKKLTSRGISHNLHLKHIESIYKHYLNQGDLVDFELFCQDLRISEQVKLSSPSSSSGSSAIEDLSNRDDITMFSPACENERVINGILEDIIRRALLSTDIQYLKQMLKIYKLSLEDREAYVTERKFIKTMSSLPLQLSKSEIDRLSRILVTYQSGKHLYDLGKLLRILEAQLERFDGHSISLPLTQKIYECFFEAAKRNISGRKLLEKCDEDNSGFVSIHEFLTILRLMGCKLSENDIKDLNSCSTGSRINYNQFLDSITHQQSRNQTNIKYALNFHSPSKEKNGIGPVMDKHIQELVIGQMSRIGVSIEQLYDTFKSYDIKASGFVSFDAVASVMHRLGIKVTPEHFRSICSRFTSRLDEKLDYVEFCDLIKPISQKSVPSSLIVQDNLSRNCFQWFDREDSSKKERRLLDSNMILGNIHKVINEFTCSVLHWAQFNSK